LELLGMGDFGRLGKFLRNFFGVLGLDYRFCLIDYYKHAQYASASQPYSQDYESTFRAG
jgi:hypothetical protein